jgi:hypothetical protein
LELIPDSLFSLKKEKEKEEEMKPKVYYRYWKAVHLPSGHYVLNSKSKAFVHTSIHGSKWYRKETLINYLKSGTFEKVSGPHTIKFELVDFEIQEYLVTLQNKEKL